MAPPGNDEGRPSARAALQVEDPGRGSDTHSMPHVSDIVPEMRRLVDDLDAQHRREQQAHSRGRAEALAEMRDFGILMWKGGYEQAHRDMTRAWKPVATAVRGLATTKTHAELEHARWGGRREDFGKPRPGDFAGGRPRPTTYVEIGKGYSSGLRVIQGGGHA